MSKAVKKLILAVLLICTAAAQFPDSAYAQTSSKEKADLTISTARQWNEFAMQLNNGYFFEGKLVKLTKDIKFNHDFIMAGDFLGTFDGGGHTISRASYTANAKPYWAGIFRGVGEGAAVKNLTVKNSSFKVADSHKLVHDSHGGIICGCLVGGTIENCHVVDSEVNCYDGNAGGIVGQNWGGTVVNCSSNASVKGYDGCGGIVGEIAENGNVYNCFSSGKINCRRSARDTPSIGGIAGYCGRYNDGDTKKDGASVMNCYSTCTFDEVYALNDPIEGCLYGGIMGCVGSSSKEGTIIKNCYYNDYDKDIALTGFQAENYAKYTAENVKSMTLSEMGEKSFADELNRNRGSNQTWLKWELAGSTPTFAPLYEVTFNAAKNGYAKVDYGYANQGQTITLTLVPNKKYKKSSVQVKTRRGKNVTLAKKNSTGTKYTFTMPDDDLVVTAKFKK